MSRAVLLGVFAACVGCRGWAADLTLWCIPEMEEDADSAEIVALRLIVENASEDDEIMLDVGSLWNTHFRKETIGEDGEIKRTAGPNHMSSYRRFVAFGPGQMFGRRMELHKKGYVSIEGLLDGTHSVSVSVRYQEKGSGVTSYKSLDAIPLVCVKGVPGHTSQPGPYLASPTAKDLHAIPGPGRGEDRPPAPAGPTGTRATVPPGQASPVSPATEATEAREHAIGFSTESVFGFALGGTLFGFAIARLLSRRRAR